MIIWYRKIINRMTVMKILIWKSRECNKKQNVVIYMQKPFEERMSNKVARFHEVLRKSWKVLKRMNVCEANTCNAYIRLHAICTVADPGGAPPPLDDFFFILFFLVISKIFGPTLPPPHLAPPFTKILDPPLL